MAKRPVNLYVLLQVEKTDLRPITTKFSVRRAREL
jgi:hypothetical protein